MHAASKRCCLPQRKAPGTWWMPGEASVIPPTKYSYQFFFIFKQCFFSFIILGHFSCFRRAVFLLFSAISAVFGGRYLYYFPPFLPFLEGGICIVLGHFGHFRRGGFLLFLPILAIFGGQYCYYFRPFWSFSEGGNFIIFGHFGRFRRAVLLLFSALLAFIRFDTSTKNFGTVGTKLSVQRCLQIPIPIANLSIAMVCLR